ncbi:uncharacterized protein B0P05DRAFT_559376 [Gilbertella persicaria]|uniref:uncharacterized protein n=1 Tax=Gilbertella persicaria TaxID=101096 RepID=UPI00221FDC08|nr:uncharacterized protein B0P05DRAFT_559376 [Gilbertella persicaria]KAI8058665.1 hypothetical protein B0P05DRAFT_559376 [Gilbertella persicaria]
MNKLYTHIHTYTHMALYIYTHAQYPIDSHIHFIHTTLLRRRRRRKKKKTKTVLSV